LCFARDVPPTADSLPDDIATLKAMVIAAETAALAAEVTARNAGAEVKARNAGAEVKARALQIEQMKFTSA
jgi:transposase